MTKKSASGAAAFTVERLEHEVTKADYVRVSFEKTGGRGRGQVIEPVSLLHDQRRLWLKLVDAGADLSKVEPRALSVDLIRRMPNTAGHLFATGGWKSVGDHLVFVLGGEVLGCDGQVPLAAAPIVQVYAGSTLGNLADWTATVATTALHSKVASVALLASFAAPLRYFAADLSEGFVINLAGLSKEPAAEGGNSSTGKSTAHYAAASVWGNPKDRPTWDTSPRSLAEMAAALSDVPLVVDDTDQNSKMPPEQRMDAMFEAAHWLSEGRGRNYASMVTEQLPRLSFRCLALSASARSIGEHLSREVRDRQDSDRARLIEILVPHADDGGIWAGADLSALSATSTVQLSVQLRSAAEANYGHAGRVWIEHLLSRQDKLRKRVSKCIAKFVSRVAPDEAGVRARVASKIGLLYAAGILAARAGILPLQQGQARRIATFAYEQAMAAAFPETTARKDLLKELAVGLLSHPRMLAVDKRKDVLDGTTPAVLEIASENRLYVNATTLDAIWAEVAGASARLKPILDNLRQQGVLLPGHGNKNTQKIRVGSQNREVRYIAIDLQKLRAIAEPTGA